MLPPRVQGDPQSLVPEAAEALMGVVAERQHVGGCRVFSPHRRRVRCVLQVALLWLVVAAQAQAAPVPPRPEKAESGSPRWLTLTFLGLGTSLAAGTATAWALRENYARRWNSEQCLRPGLQRGQVCGDLLSSGRRAERTGYVMGAGTVALLGAALASWLLEAPAAAERVSSATHGCGLSAGGVTCVGSF